MNDAAGSQDEVMAFLADPATYGAAGTVRRIDTHAATVFLAGERAIKIKRAVRFPFLDFSSLEKRKNACTAELAVNRPYAPQIYRGVVAITREADGRLALGGKGTPVEWAVDMRRFDENRTLDHATDAIDEALADALGRAVAAAHAQASPLADAAPWIAALGSYVDEHVEAFTARPEIFPQEQVDSYAQASRVAYARIVPLLRARGRHGLIRRIHGDLHLGNIVLIDDKPVLFDAIEFNDIIASGDVLYDLAFLLMDLLERGLPLPANIVFNRHLTQSNRDSDLDALAALPFFLSMRAAIRAKVTIARMERAEQSRQGAIAGNARAYFDFALRAIAPPAPRLIAVCGLSGTGKSVLARRLAPHVGPMPGAAILRSDVERKRLFGAAEAEKLGQEAYTAEVNQRVYAILTEKAHRILAAGHSAILDAVFAQPREREAAAAVAKSAAVPLRGLFLTANRATRMARVGARAGDASDADESVVRAQERYRLGTVDWTAVDASGTVEETLARALAALG